MPRVSEDGKKQFVKIAVKTDENGQKSKNYRRKCSAGAIFSQCKNMEGWNLNVFQAGRKKFVIAVPASCDCSPGAAPGGFMLAAFAVDLLIIG